MYEQFDSLPQGIPPAGTAEQAVAREREQFAQMLHDTVCQSLSGLQFMSAVLVPRLSAAAPECQADLESLREGIAHAAEEAHKLELALRAGGTAKRG